MSIPSYLNPALPLVNNFTLLVDHNALKTEKLEKVVIRKPTDVYDFKGSDPSFLCFLSVSLVALGIIFGVLVGAVFGSKKGIVAGLISAFPILYTVKRFQVISAWRREVDGAAADLAKIFRSMSEYFVQKRKEREVSIARKLQNYQLESAQAMTKDEHAEVITLAGKIKVLKNPWEQYLPRETRPTIASSDFHRLTSMQTVDLSDWQELQQACNTYLKPSTVYPSTVGFKPDDYVYINRNKAYSFVTFNEIPLR